MKPIRAILGAMILFFDRLFAPTSVQRPAEAQKLVDEQTRGLKLYQFAACPFCVKVRRHLKRRALNVELRDILLEPHWDAELVAGGGQRQVPCLRIEEPTESGASGASPQVRWLYESDDIIAYLDKRFA